VNLGIAVSLDAVSSKLFALSDLVSTDNESVPAILEQEKQNSGLEVIQSKGEK
jgi:hypothetical protein